eukprot:7991891-Alexandrium_andersonii.AAC.1
MAGSPRKQGWTPLHRGSTGPLGATPTGAILLAKIPLRRNLRRREVAPTPAGTLSPMMGRLRGAH